MLQVVAHAPDLPPIMTPPPGAESMSGPVAIILALVIVGGAVLVFYPLMRAIARRIEGRHKLDPALYEEMEQLRAGAGEVEALHHRVAELEERLDFTERMLARGNPVPEEH